MTFNRYGVWAIFRFEMARFFRTMLQSVLTPVITTSLYFVVFGAAIGARFGDIDGVTYGAFIVPGLIMLSLFTESIFNASFGIHFPKYTGTIYELLSAPVSPFEIVLGYVGAAAAKSVLLGFIILATAAFFVPLRIAHAGFALLFLLGAAVQYNDPDPLRWIAIYLAAGGSCILAAMGRGPSALAPSVAAVALVWAAILVPDALGSVRPAELVGAWEMKDERVEVGREMYGLLIIAAWMIVIAVTGLRRRRRNA